MFNTIKETNMKKICVFAGSSKGSKDEYIKVTQNLGNLLAQKGITLVYGGGNVGLMKIIADSVLEAKGKVIGIIPKTIDKLEVTHNDITELHIVDSMHQRKAMMEEMSDSFIVLPGGLGTLDEMFEVLSWCQLGFHHKPCGILNIGGYYDSLLKFLDEMIDDNFASKDLYSFLLVAHKPDQILDKILNYKSPKIRRSFYKL